jgi:hypothetical protein
MIVRHSNKLEHPGLDIIDEVNDHSSPFIDPVIKTPQSEATTTKMPFHVALTSTDAPYTKWQCRIVYHWYKKFKDQPGPKMGEFTRVLHSGVLCIDLSVLVGFLFPCLCTKRIGLIQLSI